MAGETFQTDGVFVGIAILSTAAIVLMWSVRQFELKCESWNPQRET